MEGVSPEEIANILLLVGMYAGVVHFSEGLTAEATLLTTLKKLVAGGGALDVAALVPALRQASPT